MHNDLNSSSDIFSKDLSKLTVALRTQSLVRSLPEAYIMIEGKIITKAFETNKLLYTPPENSFARADIGEMTIMSSTQVSKVYALVKLNDYNDSYLFAGRSMDANVISTLNDTISAKMNIF